MILIAGIILTVFYLFIGAGLILFGLCLGGSTERRSVIEAILFGISWPILLVRIAWCGISIMLD